MAFNIAYTYQLIDKYTAPIQKIIAATRAHTKFLNENQAAIKSSNAMLTKMANRSERLQGSLNALGGNNALKHLTDQARGLNEQIDKMGRAHLPKMPGAGGAPGGAAAGGRMSRFGAAASGLSGVGGGMAMAGILKQTAQVENAMIDLGRATDLPAADLKKFEERFMTLSEKIGISTDKLAIMAFEAAKTGLPTEDLERFVKITANSAVSFEILEDEAGRALGSIKAKLGLSVGALEELMDRINFVADATSADGARMINIVERLSGTFNALRVPPEVAAGFAGFADQIEVSQERAATGMEAIIGKLMQSPAMAAEMIKNPAEALRTVFKKLEALPQTERIAVAIKKFGLEHADFALKMATNMNLFDETMKKAADAKALGSMEREMQSKLKSMSMLWRNLKNGVLNVAVAIGEGLAPDIKKLGDWLREIAPKVREFVREHPGLVKIGIAFAAILAAVALAAPIIWALGAAFSFVGAAIGLISLPLLAVGGLIAGIVWRWGEWTKSGHPLVTVITSISDRIGRIIDKIGTMMEKNGLAKKSIDVLKDSFDFLGVMIAKCLEPLDRMLISLEKITDLTSKEGIFKAVTENPVETASALRGFLPGPLRVGMDLLDMAKGSAGEQSVNGTITVKAEPGTKAKVTQPSLPTGSNVRLATGGGF